MARKKGAKMPAVAAEATRGRKVAVRLELDESDHERLELHARRRRLSLASLARMVVGQWLDEADREDASR